MVIKSLFSKLFFSWNWLCAYRIIDEQELSTKSPIFEDGEIREYKHIKMPRNYWVADPFVASKDGTTVAFFEITDQKKHKSMLAAKQLVPTEGKLKIIYEFEGHTSYPCIFEYKDKLYMIPETGYSRTVELFECKEWPYVWEKKCDLLKDVRTADCTPFEQNGEWYIFVYDIDSKTRARDLYIGKLNLEQGEITDLKLAKHYPDLLGRPGGACFEVNGDNIRVVQPSNNFYSEKIEFYKFDYSENEGFSETKVGEITAENIRLTNSNMKFVGTHTFNRWGNVEIIDVLTHKRFMPLRPLKRLFKIAGVFGYGFYEKKRKYLNGKYPIHMDRDNFVD